MKLGNTIALVFWKLGLPTGFWTWLAHAPLGGKLTIKRGSVIITEKLKIDGPVWIGKKTSLFSQELELGRHVRIGHGVNISARKVHLRYGSQIDDDVAIDGGNGFGQSAITLGRGAWIFPSCIINTTAGVTIGDGSAIGGRSMLWTHGGWQSHVEGYPSKFASTTIGKNVWLPWSVIVLPGVSIGDDCTLTAGSVVTQNIPAHSLASGSPARVVASGPGKWPMPLQGTRSKRFAEIVASFAQTLAPNGDFNWKRATFFASAAPAWKLAEMNETSATFDCDSRRVMIDWSDLAGAAAPADFSVENGLRVIKGATSTASGNILLLDKHRFQLPHSHPLFNAFVRFSSNYGLHLLDEESGLPNHRLP